MCINTRRDRIQEIARMPPIWLKYWHYINSCGRHVAPKYAFARYLESQCHPVQVAVRFHDAGTHPAYVSRHSLRRDATCVVRVGILLPRCYNAISRSRSAETSSKAAPYLYSPNPGSWLASWDIARCARAIFPSGRVTYFPEGEKNQNKTQRGTHIETPIDLTIINVALKQRFNCYINQLII